MSYILTFAISLILSLVLTPVVRKVMLKVGILDQPSEHRWHRQPVALMGGIAIFVSFMVATLFSAFKTSNFSLSIGVILLSSSVIFALGLLDDLFGTYPKTKFAVQVLIAITMIPLGVTSKIFPYNWMNFGFTVLWIVGITNALNLLDNMDGLSSGVAIIAACAILGLGIQQGELLSALFALALIGSCLGFLRYNFKPAKIFMGDCGSLFIGFMLATLAIRAGWQHSSPFWPTLLPPIVALSVPIFDTSLVTILRVKHGRMPWHGGKDHSSHRLVAIMKGLRPSVVDQEGNERLAVLSLYGLSVLSGGLALIIPKLNSIAGLAIAVVLGTGLVLLGMKLAKIECL
jgi:UDP-GlcNAc:undecaprenyl-phosphate GlcNAc-1-phosphate transferase